MAKKFKAVFIMEDGEYKEITNEEHQLRKAEDEEYKRKYFIPVDDFLMEVTYQKYKSFYREKEHEKYIKKRDKKKGLILFGELTEVTRQRESDQERFHCCCTAQKAPDRYYRGSVC